MISIITPTKNCRKYIEECIKSSLNQSYFDVEHLFIDGGSSDGTREFIREYESKYPAKIKFIAQTGVGIGEAWNQGLAAAKGEILGWIGADDSFVPDAFSIVVEFFNKNPDAFFVYGGQNFIDKHGNIIISCLPEPFNYETLLNKKQMICTTSAFYRKQVIDTVGLIDPMGNDFDFYLRVAQKFRIYSINFILSNFRIHEESQTNGASIQRRKKWLKAWCQTCRSHHGSRFSTYCLKYYTFYVFAWALPIWNFIYFHTNQPT
mgnify:CR=1 FL=1